MGRPIHGLVVAGEPVTLHALHLVLSHSRGETLVWTRDQARLSWLSSYNDAFRAVCVRQVSILRIDKPSAELLRTRVQTLVEMIDLV